MKKHQGFSMLEAMVAVAIIAILASMALPSYMIKLTREQIEKALPIAEIPQHAVEARWKAEQKLEIDNASAALPSPDKFVNNFVKSVAIENGAVHVTFGNRANDALKDKVISFRPAVVDDSPIIPITWVCAGADAPEKTSVKGVDKTTVNKQYLPYLCRPKLK